MRARSIIFILSVGTLVMLTSCWSQKTEYARTFEFVWKKVNETYFDTTFGGLNWKDVHDRYLPQITAAANDDQFYRLVNKMLWELKVSHANLVPPGLLALREPLVCAEASPGIGVRVLNGLAVITSVTPGSSAESADLRRGYVIRAIDGVPIDQIVQESESIVRPPENSRNRIAVITKAILGRIYGIPGT